MLSKVEPMRIVAILTVFAIGMFLPDCASEQASYRVVQTQGVTDASSYRIPIVHVRKAPVWPIHQKNRKTPQPGFVYERVWR